MEESPLPFEVPPHIPHSAPSIRCRGRASSFAVTARPDRWSPRLCAWAGRPSTGLFRILSPPDPEASRPHETRRCRPCDRETNARRPSRPATASARWQRGQTGRMCRRQEPTLCVSPLREVRANLRAGVRAQKTHEATTLSLG